MRQAHTITWQTGDGRDVEITVGLTVPGSLAGNLRTAEQTAERAITIKARLAGQGLGGWLVRESNHPLAVAHIGKLGITAANLARIDAVIAKLEASDEYQASKRMWAKWATEQANYETDHAAIERAMRAGE